MSPSSPDTEREDQTILEALDALASGRLGEPDGGPRGDESSETLVRLYTEVLGLLPYGLEPAEPSPALKERLLAIVAGDETQAVDVEPAKPAAKAAEPPRAVAVKEVESLPPPRPPAPPAAAPLRRPSRWPLALAAALVLALLGLSAWLYQGLRQQGETIAELSRELDEARQRSTDLEGARTELVDLKEKLSLVTSPAVEINPMRPSGPAPLQPGARGLLFVAADHHHWYLSVEGLEPARPGQAYQLWFMADTGPVSAGSFTAAPGAPVALSSAHMPPGTRAVIVTLESEGATAPTGPEVLRAG